MILQMADYATGAVATVFREAMAGYESLTGKPLGVHLTREYTFEPIKPPPQVWVQAELPERVARNLIGAQVDPTQGNTIGVPFVLEDRLPVNFGVRCKASRERDELLDFLVYSLTVGSNPATGNQWWWDMYGTYGMLLTDVSKIERTTAETKAFGQVYEAQAAASFNTAIQATYTLSPVTGITLVLQGSAAQ